MREDLYGPAHVAERKPYDKCYPVTGSDLHSLYTNPAQHRRTAYTGSTVDYADLVDTDPVDYIYAVDNIDSVDDIDRDVFGLHVFIPEAL